MTDLLAMLRKIQNLKPGDMMPEEWGPGEWGIPLSKLCGEAADEIDRLRTHGNWIKWSVVNDPLDWSTNILGTGTMPREVEIKQMQAAAPEPWGSPYAMNPENWK